MTHSFSKRLLSLEEKTEIYRMVEECIPRFLPMEMKTLYMEKMIKTFREELDRIELIVHPEAFFKLKQAVMQRVQRAICPAGEGVGVICAQSIGERQTQLTLNSFHQSGLAVATVVTGVPRFLELLNATKEPKMSCNRFRIKGSSACTPAQIRRRIGDSLVFLTLKDLILRDTISLHKEEEVWFDAFETVYTNRFRDFYHSLTVFLNLKKMHQYQLTPMKIAQRLEEQFSDICCVFSPLVIGQFDIFVDTSDIHLPDNASSQLPQFISCDNYLQVYLEDVVKPRLLDIAISGLAGIKKYHIVRDEKNGFQVETEGSNLEQLVMLSSLVDISSVSSNHMWEVYSLMGIEATRQFLIDEFTSIVSSDGTFINKTHIALLVDIMTHQGVINSISRYGLKREQVGVLSRSSFEESLDHFCNAGFYAEKEPIKAVSAAIMCGKRSRIGSGLCSLIMDWNKMKK